MSFSTLLLRVSLVPIMHVIFIHPDLGIGGAERFIVDAAISLQDKGHQTTIFTPYFDPSRCFADVAHPSPRVRVECISPPIPRSVFGRFQVRALKPQVTPFSPAAR